MFQNNNSINTQGSTLFKDTLAEMSLEKKIEGEQMLKKNRWNFVFMLSLLLGVAASCENDDSDYGDNKAPSHDVNLGQDDTLFDPASTDWQQQDSGFDSGDGDNPAGGDPDTGSATDEPKDTGSNSAVDTSSDEEEPTDDEPQDTGPAPEPIILNASHPGWQNPGCWQGGCHAKKQTHNSQMKPNACAKCHGKNGATKRQPPHFPCIGCHSPIKNHNPVGDFSNLATCPACHG